MQILKAYPGDFLNDRPMLTLGKALTALPARDRCFRDAQELRELDLTERRGLSFAECLERVSGHGPELLPNRQHLVKNDLLPKRQLTVEGAATTVTGMATITRIGPKSGQHLYITAWFEHFGLNDAKVAARIEEATGVPTSRQTVFRWRKDQKRLDPGKIQALADALEIEPEQFWRLPSRPSVDAILKDAPIEVVAETMADAARRIARRK